LFRGVSTLNLDGKGRLAIPTRYRDRLVECCAANLILTINATDPNDRCLLLYPLADWEVVEQNVMRLPDTIGAARRMKRLMVGHATDTPMDAQGRILIPAEHRQYAGLDKRVVMIGQRNKFELWDEERWNQQRDLWLEEELAADGELSAGLASLSI